MLASEDCSRWVVIEGVQEVQEVQAVQDEPILK
jgi:hypothetical protein